MDINGNGFFQSDKILACFDHKEVSHIIMMVTRLTKAEGPCAVSLEMRRFKKLLLQYVLKNPNVRLSILAEADKLTGRRGFQADIVDLPGVETAHDWDNVLSSGRVTVIAAISSEMTPAQEGLAKREMQELHNAGARAVLLGTDGEEINLQDESSDQS